MLYDQRWDAKTKADPFSLESLIAWLEKQPADGTYCWPRISECLACKYLEAIGFKEPWKRSLKIHPHGYRGLFGSRENYHAIGRSEPWTFGAALARARAVLTERAGA